MAKAVATGMPKLRIEECAAKRQARIDSGQGRWNTSLTFHFQIQQVTDRCCFSYLIFPRM